DEERIALTKLPEAQQAATETVLYRVVASVTPSSGAAVRTVKEGPVPAAHAPTDSRSGICSAKLAFPVSPGYVAFPTGAEGQGWVALRDAIVVPRSVKTFERAFARLPDQFSLDGPPKPLAEYEHPIWRFRLTFSQ
ncbi:MAG: hypothetical protein ACYTFT_00005, partial [Planctomycetota bacterium]